METLKIKIPSRVIVDKRLEELIKKYGKGKVAKILGEYFEYEVIKEVGDIYKEAIELWDNDLDAIEEMLEEGGA